MKTFAALTTSVVVAVIGLATAQTVGECKNGTYVIVARGSYEPPPEGISMEIADRIVERIPGSESVGLDYPATISDPTYFESQPQGVRTLTRFIGEYSDKCPSTKLVLLGYSQGAHVIGDVLLGSAASGFPENTPLDTKYVDRVLAAILFGDPGFVLNVPINVGNATKGGLFKRSNTDQWTARGLVGRVKSYCDFNDTFCDSGSSNVVHSGYVPEYGTQAVDFIVSRFQNASTTASSSSSSSSATTGISSSISGTVSTASPTVLIPGSSASSLSSTHSSSSTSSGATSSTGGPSSSSPASALTGAANGLQSFTPSRFVLVGLVFGGLAFVS